MHEPTLISKRIEMMIDAASEEPAAPSALEYGIAGMENIPSLLFLTQYLT